MGDTNGLTHVSLLSPGYLDYEAPPTTDISLRRGFTWRLLWRRFLPTSCSRFRQRQIPPFKTITNVLRFCVNLLVIFGYFGKDIFFFLKDRLNWGKDELMQIWWVWKIEIWSEELVDWHQTVSHQPGGSLAGVNCLVAFPAHFNLHNSFLKLLLISLLFR